MIDCNTSILRMSLGSLILVFLLLGTTVLNTLQWLNKYGNIDSYSLIYFFLKEFKYDLAEVHTYFTATQFCNAIQ